MKRYIGFVAGVVSLTAVAQGAPAAAKKPESAKKENAEHAAPKLPAEAKKWLEGHRGHWKSTDVTMTMGEQTMKGKMSMKCEAASNDWATLCHAKFEMGKEMPPSQSTFLFAWNLGTNEATMFEVSDMAEVHAHVGKWADDKSITVTHTGKNAEGKDEVDALTFTWVSPKEIAMTAQGTQGGTVVWSMSGTAKK